MPAACKFLIDHGGRPDAAGVERPFTATGSRNEAEDGFACDLAGRITRNSPGGGTDSRHAQPD